MAWLQKTTAEQCGVKPYIQTQVIVHDGEIAGTLDFWINGRIADLKCTYDISPLHAIQVAAYGALSTGANSLGLIHVTERFKEAKWISVDVDQALKQWRIVREFWSLYKSQLMTSRKAAKPA